MEITLQILTLIAFAAVAAGAIVLIVVLMKKDYKTKYENLNDIISNRLFVRKLKYELKNYPDQSFNVLVCKLSDYLLIKDKLNYFELRSYLKDISKKISYVLPERSKITLYPSGVFYIYIPGLYYENELHNISLNIADIAAKKVEFRSGKVVYSDINIGQVNYPNLASTYEEIMNLGNLTLYLSLKDGANKIKFYKPEMVSLKDSANKFIRIYEKIMNSEYRVLYTPVLDVKNKVYNSAIVDLFHLENKKAIGFSNFISEYEISKDAYWFSLWYIKKIVYEHKVEYIIDENNYKLIIPIILSVFEEETFNSWLIDTLNKNNIRPSNIIFKIINPLSKISDSTLLESLGELKGYGVNFLIDVNNVNERLEQNLIGYRISNIKIPKELVILEDRSTNINRLLAFLKEHEINVIVDGIKTTEEVETLIKKDIYLLSGELFSRRLSADRYFAKIREPISYEKEERKR
ncbi:MAG: EAL domain-containing protein [Acholeplasmatales bacterium]